MAPWSSLFSWLLIIQEGIKPVAVMKKKLPFNYFPSLHMTVSQPSFGSVEKSETAQSHERVYGVYGYDIISFFSLNELI